MNCKGKFFSHSKLTVVNIALKLKKTRFTLKHKICASLEFKLGRKFVKLQQAA